MAKKTKKNIKVRDLTPKKDAKGGVVANVSTDNARQSHNVSGRTPQGRTPFHTQHPGT